MKISNVVKDLLVGFPVVLFCAVVILWSIAKFGSIALLFIGGLVFLVVLGSIVGFTIRDKLGIWK